MFVLGAGLLAFQQWVMADRLTQMIAEAEGMLALFLQSENILTIHPAEEVNCRANFSVG